MSGQIARKKNVSIDICLRDSYRTPIGFASTGAFNLTKDVTIPEGEAQLAVTLTVPKLAIGQYSLDLFLTDPFVEFIEKLEDALRFDVQEGDGRSVQQLQQKWGYGSVYLEMKVDCNVYV